VIDKAEPIANQGLFGVDQADAGLEQSLAQTDETRDDRGDRHHRQRWRREQLRVRLQFQQRFPDRGQTGIGLLDEAAEPAENSGRIKHRR